MNQGVITSFSAPSGWTSTSYGTTLTANVTAHVKGSYAQLFASTGFDATGFYAQIVRSVNPGRTFLVDFATGAAASEVVILGNLAQAVGDDVSGGASLYNVNLPIAASTRVA